MRCKFIGMNGSMGLKRGKSYNVHIIECMHRSKRIMAVIYLGDIFNRVIACPYSSLTAFAKNWLKE